ncbi:MAG: hypothetical protein Ct9H300mP27_10390 [Chloroflexota bacterium]|nr:MAG: hypothetical protein Ct9H300mP27_10390 [Chloroflexota bacterium]
MTQTIIGITLWTDNFETMFHFYHQVLGGPIHSKKVDFIAFQLGDIRFNIGNLRTNRRINKDPYRIMPHLEVTDIHRENERLSNLGVSFIGNQKKSIGEGG